MRLASLLLWIRVSSIWFERQHSILSRQWPVAKFPLKIVRSLLDHRGTFRPFLPLFSASTPRTSYPSLSFVNQRNDSLSHASSERSTLVDQVSSSILLARHCSDEFDSPRETQRWRCFQMSGRVEIHRHHGTDGQRSTCSSCFSVHHEDRHGQSEEVRETRFDSLQDRSMSDFREEAYRFLWREMEYFVRGYKDTSENHRHIYQSIVDGRKVDTDTDSSLYPRSLVDLFFPHWSSLSFSNKLEFVFPTDETSSTAIPLLKREKNAEKLPGRVWNEFSDLKQVLAGQWRRRREKRPSNCVLANSLREMWNRKQQEKRAPEFDGRMEYPPPRPIPLYVNLNTKASLPPPPPTLWLK